MTKEQVILFTIKPTTTNERVILTFKDNKEVNGYFEKSPLKEDNKWNFITFTANDKTKQIVVEGNDLLDIKIISISKS
jgi:hypothetical protein